MGLQIMALLAVSLWLSPPESKPLRAQVFERFEAGAALERALFVVSLRVCNFSLRISISPGTAAYSAAHEAIPALGRHMPVMRAASVPASKPSMISLRFRIDAVDAAGEHSLTDQTVKPWRATSGDKNHIVLRMGAVELQPGYYRLSVTVLDASSALATTRASLEASWEPGSALKSQQRMPDSIAALLPLLEQDHILDMVIEQDLLQQFTLQRVSPQHSMDRGVWRTDSYLIPRGSGVLSACDYQARIHRDTGNFWIIRRCDGQSATAYQGALTGWQAPVMAQRPLLRF
ncbi:hypothetical protein [Viridibacterium curvum]|uniref:Uncharacterized protein n=1 Tax=Viridibacterium curvum TaxID=1101404 RepID=A0ABP9QGU2_9RHOO